MSSGFPGWLPDMVSVSPWTDETYDHLYSVFHRDLKRGGLTFQGYNVWFYNEVDGGKEIIFWHLTTRDDKSVNPPARLPDLRRSERLSWIRPIISRCPCPSSDVLSWDFEEGNGDIKTYIWLQNHDFIVICKKLPDGKRRLITSFHLDSHHQASKMQKKYAQRLN